MRVFLLLLIFLITSAQAFTQNKKHYNALLCQNPPKIDGVLDDAIWQNQKWEGGFVQREPHADTQPSQQTFFLLAYDNNAIYVAIKAMDLEMDKVDMRMTRRDKFEGDLLGVHFDSYHDKLTSFSFFVNAAGVKSDAIFADGGNKEDVNWNPIWHVKTSKDGNAFYAEMKIPLSQLRFSSAENKVWGFNVSRYIFRSEELSLWNPVPKEASGWVYDFGELHNLKNIKPKRIVEVAPYVSGGFERFEKEEGNPFYTGKNLLYNAGLDGKIGITNDIVLDFTINPDFGQVEADPSEVNLTGFETFFQEQRPFFIEGSSITDFKITPGDHEAARDNLFYSRRLGRAPQYYPDLRTNEYMDYADATRILGAIKISGKTQKGLSVGIVESMTRNEVVDMEYNGVRSQQSVEPFTNYLVGRVQKDFHGGNALIGGEFTSTNRSIQDSALLFLPKSAQTGGFDFQQYWKDRKYYLSFNLAASTIYGDSLAIADRQTAGPRYFQRPDAEHITLDSTLRSMQGFGGNFGLGKNVESGFTYGFNITWRSPGFSLNDVGYLRNADKITQTVSLGYKITNPKYFYRKINMGLVQWNGWDFGGNSIFNGGMMWINTQLKNQFNIRVNASTEFGIYDNYKLRGGPAFHEPGNVNIRISLVSNQTKKFYMDFGTRQTWGQFGYSRNNSWDAGFIYRPFDALGLEFHPNFGVKDNALQYVDELDINGSKQYLLANIHQSTLHFRFRINYNITPDLTIQYYGSPFISTGSYDSYKRVNQARADAYEDRFYAFPDAAVRHNEANETLELDTDGDQIFESVIDEPNFNFKQFQSNLVLRWEFVPGSALFLVWAQNRTNYDGPGLFTFNDDMSTLFRTFPHDVFLIKFSYRFLK